MDFTTHVRAHLAQLETSREPEIVAELAQHLQDLYQEAIASGASHHAAVTRALAALPAQPETLARDIERAGRSLPAIVTDRWRSHAPEPVPQGSRASVVADLWRDVRYSVRMLAAAPVFTAIVVLTKDLACALLRARCCDCSSSRWYLSCSLPARMSPACSSHDR